MVWRAACVFWLSALAALPAWAGSQNDPVPLAQKRLLLDIERAGERLVAVGRNGHVLLSDDDGETWRQAMRVPPATLLTDVVFTDPMDGWAVGHDAVILHTGNGGETWVTQYRDEEAIGPLLSIHMTPSGYGLAVGSFSEVLETQDGGWSWHKRRLFEGHEDDFHLQHLFVAPDGTLYITAEFGVVYRRAPGASAFEALATGYEGSLWGGLALADGTLLIHGMRGTLMISSDRGETWQRIEAGTDQSLTASRVLQNGSLVLVGLGGALLHAVPGSMSFRVRHLDDRTALTGLMGRQDASVIVIGEKGIRRLPSLP